MPSEVELPFDPAREEAELRGYLGPRFAVAHLHNHRARLDAEFADSTSEADFYRTSEAYLYDLTVFAMSGTKLPYLKELTKHIPPGARVLDYGCGIGSDGLMLLEAGYSVEFADYDNPSTRYLRWRLQGRGLDAPVHDLDRGVPGDFDLAYAFDVIEHVPNPLAFLAEMEQRARLVVVNLLEPDPNDPELHYELPLADLLGHVARRPLRSYRVHHGRSHLLLYAPRAATGWERLVTYGRIRGARARVRALNLGKPAAR